MAMQNNYYRRSKISEAKFRQMIRCFEFDRTTTETAPLAGLPLRFVNPISLSVRQHHS